jgi:rhodanese-related sulfurtransferase
LELLAAHEANERTLYLLDVRDPSEYAEGHPDRFLSAPGGQLVQATDEWIGVRGGRAVLYDTDGVRARMTASWLLQLGWEVYVFDHEATLPELPTPARNSPLFVPPPSGEIAITVDALKTLLDNKDATVVDLARSPVYRKGHIPGAWHASGPELVRDLQSAQIRLQPDGPIVLTSPDGLVAQTNIDDAHKAVAPRTVLYLAGGTTAWTKASLPLETGTTGTDNTNARWLSHPIDVYKRPYEGTGNDREAMEGYIEWEHQLVAQLANDGVANFHVVRETRSKS